MFGAKNLKFQTQSICAAVAAAVAAAAAVEFVDVLELSCKKLTCLNPDFYFFVAKIFNFEN